MRRFIAAWILGSVAACQTPPQPVSVSGATLSWSDSALWKVTFLGLQMGRLAVRIEKSDLATGRIVSIRHAHSVGDRLGWWSDDPSLAPTSIHRVPEEQDALVDFDSGITLTRIENKRIVVPVPRCKKIYDKDSGNVITCERISQDIGIAVCEITASRDGEEFVTVVPDLRKTIRKLSGTSDCPKHD